MEALSLCHRNHLFSVITSPNFLLQVNHLEGRESSTMIVPKHEALVTKLTFLIINFDVTQGIHLIGK